VDSYIGATKFAYKCGFDANYSGYCRGYNCGADLTPPKAADSTSWRPASNSVVQTASAPHSR